MTTKELKTRIEKETSTHLLRLKAHRIVQGLFVKKNRALFEEAFRKGSLPENHYTMGLNALKFVEELDPQTIKEILSYFKKSCDSKKYEKFQNTVSSLLA